MRIHGFAPIGDLEKFHHAVERAPGGAAQSRIGLESRLRERGPGCFAKGLPRHEPHFLFRLDLGSGLGRELEEELRVVVFGEQAKKHAPRLVDRRRVLVPPVLQHPANGVDRANAVESFRPRGRCREHRVVPHAVGRLPQREFNSRLERVRKEAEFW